MSEHPSWWAHAQAMRADGKGETEIANAIGVSRGAVCRALRNDYYTAWEKQRSEKAAAERAKKHVAKVKRWARAHGLGEVTSEAALDLLLKLRPWATRQSAAHRRRVDTLKGQVRETRAV